MTNDRTMKQLEMILEKSRATIAKNDFAPVKIKHPKRNKIKERFLVNNAYLHKAKYDG